MIPVFFHEQQLEHKPLYEWSFGQRIKHPETTKRAARIFSALKKEAKNFSFYAPEPLPISILKEVHHEDLIKLYRTARTLPPGQTFCPSVFPKRHRIKADPSRISHAGFFCLDSGTPLDCTTWDAACWSAASAVSAAKLLLSGSQLIYALCRPPGHHATRTMFGGYCYFNNAALAAKVLRKKGRVAILDIDFHHGNGTQSIFYDDPQVFFVSVHGTPEKYYPFFMGYETERGSGKAVGTNLNIPLEQGCTAQEYQNALTDRVLPAITDFKPDFFIISAGFDTYHADPVGGFLINTEDYRPIGRILSSMKLPTVVIQEGGYFEKDLGRNVVSFLHGMIK
jgi:acetoin utilization deacetylase AcuC-like enzyme